MEKTLQSIKEMATNLIGDGKSPNKYFVTIAYGWYRPPGFDAEMIQVENSLDSVTVLFNNKEDADHFFNEVPMLGYGIKKVTGETIGQVIMEDRKTGVIKERYLAQRLSGSFTTYQDY